MILVTIGSRSGFVALLLVERSTEVVLCQPRPGFPLERARTLPAVGSSVNICGTEVL